MAAIWDDLVATWDSTSFTWDGAAISAPTVAPPDLVGTVTTASLRGDVVASALTGRRTADVVLPSMKAVSGD